MLNNRVIILTKMACKVSKYVIERFSQVARGQK
jgi:hypothetical protein